MFTIVVTRGDVIMLGEAYAFGVIWSFTFNSLAMLSCASSTRRTGMEGSSQYQDWQDRNSAGAALRLSRSSYHGHRQPIYKIGGHGKWHSLRGAFFVIFSLSERDNKRRHDVTSRQMKEHFQLEHRDDIGKRSSWIFDPARRSSPCAMRQRPFALKWALSRTNTDEQDLVVLAARMMGAGGPDYLERRRPALQRARADALYQGCLGAESFGKHISLLVVPAGDIFAALVQTANSLDAAAVVCGLSTKLTAQEQAYHTGQAWEQLPEPKRQFTFYVVQPDGEALSFT
jgi:hypothetical protein